MTWTARANLRGPAGYNAVGAAATDASMADFINQVAGATLTRAALDAIYNLDALAVAKVSRVYGKMKAGQNVKVTAIGDSILEGLTTTVPGTDDCLSKVALALATQFGVTVTKSNQAVSGRTVATSMVGLNFAAALATKADLYIIAFGKNDYRSDSPTVAPGTGYPSDASAGGLEHMVRRIRIEQPFADIIILGENPDTNATTNTKLIAVTKKYRTVAALYGCAFVDGHKAFTDKGSIAPYMADGIHPNTAGHLLLANAILALFPANREPVPAAPTPVPLNSLFNAERYTLLNWVTHNASTRTANLDGMSLIGAGWSGVGPYANSTAGDTALFFFTGSEVLLSLLCGAGAGTVSIDVDGQSFASSVNLALLEAGARYLPITGLEQGVHLVAVKVLSGTVTVYGMEKLLAPVEWLDNVNTRLTFAGVGSWTSTASNEEYYGKTFKSTDSVGATITFDFIGTAFGMQLQRNVSPQNFSVTIDGGTPFNVDVSRTTFNASIKGGVLFAKGLYYGRHTVAITTTTTGTRIGGVYAFDEGRIEHPFRQRGLAKVGEVIRLPVRFGSRPHITMAPADATSAIPPYPTGASDVAFTVAGTASALVSWDAEGSRIAY